MTHYSRLSNIVVDAPAADHDAEVSFWRGALGAPLERVERYPEFHGAALNHGYGLLVQQLSDGPPRVHLDIHTSDLEAEVARLVALGATVLQPMDRWTIMRDPAGVVFCVVFDRRVDATNGQEWPS